MKLKWGFHVTEQQEPVDHEKKSKYFFLSEYVRITPGDVC